MISSKISAIFSHSSIKGWSHASLSIHNTSFSNHDVCSFSRSIFFHISGPCSAQAARSFSMLWILSATAMAFAPSGPFLTISVPCSVLQKPQNAILYEPCFELRRIFCSFSYLQSHYKYTILPLQLPRPWHHIHRCAGLNCWLVAGITPNSSDTKYQHHHGDDQDQAF